MSARLARTSSLSCFLFLVLLTLTLGCSSGTATVKGKVTVNGQPLTTGNVSFSSASGMIIDAIIQPDGTYTTSGVPVGQAKVLVSAMDPSFADKMNEMVGRGKPNDNKPARGKLQIGGKPGSTGDIQKEYSLIDTKFNNYESSGLTVNVVAPTTTFDIPTTKGR